MVPRLGGFALVAAACAAGFACAAATRARTPGVERIVFVGDSLVNRSDRDHDLLARVRRALERTHPAAALDLVNAGRDGDCIADIRARLAHDVLALGPGAVVLYWDSDAADVEDAGETAKRSRALRAAYERQLDAVLSALREATPHLVVAGPTLLGERPRGQNPKDRVLDAYARINRRVTRAHLATWVDTRGAAFRWLRDHASGPGSGSGRLTEDGEHLNEAGTELVASQMASAIGPWLGSRTNAPGALARARDFWCILGATGETR